MFARQASPQCCHFMITAFKPTESLRMAGWFFIEFFLKILLVSLNMKKKICRSYSDLFMIACL